jgi:predicted nucleic acid-binding protein
LSQAAVDTAVAEFMSLPITWIDIEPYAEEAWRVHRLYKIETGDAFFVTITLEFSAEILTVDSQFAASTKIMYENICDLKVVPWRD